MSVTVKATYYSSASAQPEIRRFAVDQEVCSNFSYFSKKAEQVFPIAGKTVNFYWKDAEGDDVMFSSDEELMLALGSMATDVFKISIKVTSSSTPASDAEDDVVHPGVMCDGCQGQVKGIRYKCVTCADYDLCGTCEAAGLHPIHNMIRMVAPPITAAAHPWQQWMRMMNAYSGGCHGGPRGFGPFAGGFHCGRPQTQRAEQQQPSPGAQTGPRRPEDGAAPATAEEPRCKSGKCGPRARPKNGACPSAKTHASDPQRSATCGHSETSEKDATPMEVDMENAMKNLGEFVTTMIPAAMQQFGLDVPRASPAGAEPQSAPRTSTSTGSPPSTSSSASAGVDAESYLRQVSDAVAAMLDPLGVGVDGYAERLQQKQDVPTDAASTTNVNTVNRDDENTRTHMQPGNGPDAPSNSDPQDVPMEQREHDTAGVTSSAGTSQPTHLYPQLDAEMDQSSSDSRIARSLSQLQSMGFDNDDGWLERLLVAKNGDISRVMDAIYPNRR